MGLNLFLEGTMSTADHVVFIGWNRANPGRELEGMALFNDSLAFYEAQKKAGHIAGFEVFLLDPHGGDLNGFILLRGERGKLNALRASETFRDLVTRAHILMHGVGIIEGTTGAEMQTQMALYMKHLTKK